MASATAPREIAVPDGAVRWAAPELGFDDWKLDEALRTARRLVRQAQRIEQPLGCLNGGEREEGCPTGSGPAPPARRWRRYWPYAPGVLGLTLGTLLAARAWGDGQQGLSLWALVTAVCGQIALLTAVLVRIEAAVNAQPVSPPE